MREMKDSGVEWIGEIPIKWQTRKLFGLLGKMGSGTTPKGDQYYEDGSIPWLNTGDLNDGYIETTGKTVSELAVKDYPALQLHRAGAVVIAMYGATIGKLGITRIDLTTNQACCAMYPSTSLESKYLFYVLLSAKDYFLFSSYGAGQPNISQNTIRNLRIPFPYKGQQLEIVRYLDDKCMKIGALVERQQAVIEKLKEYKLSIIAEGVTKGIDCKAEFKDSGIEWIGKIPKHWTVTKMKQVALFFNGDRSSKYPSGEDFVDEGVFFITSNNLGEIVLDTSIETNKYITHSKYQELGGAKIRMNDIIFCLRGSVGKCAINKSITEGTIASSLVDIRTTGINPDFLNMVLHTTGVTAVASVKAIGIGSLNLAAKDISEVVIPLPPAKEAEEIAEILSNKTAKIDKKISIHERLINQLNDFKRSLIYEMVSGKKQVL